MKTFKEFLQQERRSHPDLNPKISINQIIKDYLKNATRITGVRSELNAFASFTSLEKLGINPKTPYDTPLGIYAYPLTYVQKQIGDDYHPGDRLPFAGDAEYVNLFSVKGNIVDLKYMLPFEYDAFFKELTKEMDRFKIYDLEWKVKNGSHVNTPGGHFWNLTRLIAGDNPVKWNKVFRDIGIDGCHDAGEGIIHRNEPTQDVFFSLSCVTNLKRYDNKYSPDNIEYRRDQGDNIKQLKQINVDLNNGSLNRNSIDVVHKIIELMGNKYSYISFFDNPPQDVQLYALQNDIYSIKYIKKPTVEAQKYILFNRPELFNTIDNPDEHLKDLYVLKTGNQYAYKKIDV